MTEKQYKVGPDDFTVDEARWQQALTRYDDGKGLIGGDPRNRPRWLHPLPAEPAQAFRLLQSSPEHLAKLQQFLHAAPLEIEIGSGPGDFILNRAAQLPQRHFLAFEVKIKLIRGIVRQAQKQGIKNLWVSDDDARFDLPRLLQPNSVQVIHILFPDPWWKPRHQPRRLFLPPFVDTLALLLRPGGILRTASDVPGYAQLIQQVVEAHTDFLPHQPDLAHNFAGSAPTSRQAFCDKIGRPYQFFYFQKRNSANK
jgi:tRNA (guanine-N7-)-methyltransferase